jgi:hypothetical protein
MHYSCDFLLFLEHGMEHKKLPFIMDGVLCHFPAATILTPTTTTFEMYRNGGCGNQTTSQLTVPFPQIILHLPL